MMSRFWGLLTSLIVVMLTLPATAQQTTVAREQDIAELRLGQRVLVDDGACPAGQVKEILGAKLGPTGVVRTAKCVTRNGK